MSKKAHHRLFEQRHSPNLNLGLIVPLDDLRRKILDAERRVQRGLYAVEVGLERGRG